MTSSASISSLMRMAPSWAVNPQPTVADSASPAWMGAISRVLKNAVMKPEYERDAQLVERGVTLQADLGAGEEAEEGDDADRPADDRERAAAEDDLGQQPQRLLLVAA